MDMKQVSGFLSENRKAIGFWLVIVLVGGAAWYIFGGKSPSEANAEDANAEQQAVQTAPAQPAPGQMTISTPTVTIAPGKPRTILTKPVAKSGGAQDEYQYMATMNNLAGEQLERYEQACAEREVVLAFWAKGPGKHVDEVRERMKEAKAAKDEKVVAELQPKYDLLTQMDQDMRSVLRADVMSVLTLEQQRRWGGFVLSRELQRRMPRIELSDKQKEFVRRIADEAADRLVTTETVQKDPFLNAFRTAEVLDPVFKQVRDKVLTIEQRARVPEPGKSGNKGGGMVQVR